MLRSCLNEKFKDALLLIDAKNVFNQMNRNLVFHNISNYYPSFTNAVNNTYREPPELVVEKDTILPQEGTTQGNPHSTAIYDIAT